MAGLKVSFGSNGGSFATGIGSPSLTFSPVHSVPFSLPLSYNKSSTFPIISTLSSFQHDSKAIFFLHSSPHFSTLPVRKRGARIATAMATGSAQEILPPVLDSTSEPPPLFDGTTRLYLSYSCPYAQRVWITRNCKGLQDKIKLVPLDLKNRPDWYKEKVYPANKVPSLEHNNEVIGESLDLIKYIDSHFEGPSLFPDDPVKKEFADELFSYTDAFRKTVMLSFKGDGSESGTAFDYLETALAKFDDGPFFLGQFSLVDIAYAPFVERYQPFFSEVKKYDITDGRPRLAAWIEEMDKNDAYKQTKRDPKEHVETYKKRLMAQA